VCAAAAGYHVGVRSAYSTACCHPRRARCSPPRSHSQPPHSRQVRATRQVSTPPWRGAGRLAWRGGPCARRVVRADPLSEVQRGLQPGLAQVCQEEPAQPSEIARAVAFLLDPDSAYHGSVLFVDGGTDAVLRPKRSDTPIGHASYGPLIHAGRSDLEVFRADHRDARPHECDRHHLRVGVQITRIRTLAGPPGLNHAATLNGGSASGYQDFFGPLATRQSRLRHGRGPALAVFLYIAMLGVNVLNCPQRCAFPVSLATGLWSTLHRYPAWQGAEGALTIIPWIMLGSVIAVVLAIKGPRLHPFFGVFERLFYLSSITWVLIVAIDLARISG
jgi:hypothetical protein